MRGRTLWSIVGAAAILLVAVAITAGGGFAQSATPGAGTPCASPAASPEAMGSPMAGTPAACGGTTVGMYDIYFQPKEITIPANTATKVTLVNHGAIAHSFVIDQLKVNSGLVPPGGTKEVEITAAAGDYQYYCDVPGHKEAGMVGTLHVK